MSITSISNANSTAASARPDPREFLQKMFARLDGDSDGKITQDEFSTAMEKRFGKSDAADRPDAATIFQKTDSDGDGAITLSEFETAFKAMRGSGGQGGAGAGARAAGEPPPGPPPSGGHGGASAAEEAEQVFDEMDTDKDGKVSAEELLAALKKKAEEHGQSTDATSAANAAPDFEKLFAAIDTDGDGSVTPPELTSLFEALRPAREPHSGYAADGSPSEETAVGSNIETTA